VRELGRQLELSASLIFQIGLGHVVPPVSTLYALSAALVVSMDSLFGEDNHASDNRRWSKGRPPRIDPGDGETEHALIQPRESRRAIDLK
jgi:transcriptional regulator with XRE-family HTH domain